MLNLPVYYPLFKKLNCCVIVPAFNNAGSLYQLLLEVKKYCNDIIVVNDGSTDNSTEILNLFQDIQIISYSKNRGKGYALKKGFAAALNAGFDYAITIDADLQHKPSDFEKFLTELEINPNSIIVGARIMEGAGQPASSSFANKFSNFWFRVETGIKLPDTQSGYRLYPLQQLKGISFFSNKYEFELEVLVRAAWRGIPIKSTAISVYYPPPEKRISHFRPFRDFSRISILNTILVIIAFFYIKPFSFIRYLKRTNIKKFFLENILHAGDSNIKITASVMLGIFMGILPIWGWQLVVAIALAYLFKLNKLVVIVSANISIPPLIPFILYFSFITGGIILGNMHPLDADFKMDFEFIASNIFQYILGSIVLAVCMSLSVGLISYILLQIFRKRQTSRQNPTPNQI